MSEFIEMTYEEWEYKFKPIKNHLTESAAFDGTMFETYGEELEFVQNSNPECIWTEGQGDDGGCYIWNEYHYINRLGYFITEIPCPPNTTIQIKTADPDYECGNCGSYYMGAEAEEIKDKFYDLPKCPDCATPQELKELEADNANV